jgi:hypothetical protein
MDRNGPSFQVSLKLQSFLVRSEFAFVNPTLDVSGD